MSEDSVDDTDKELIDLGDIDADAFNDYAEAQGWSDGLPLVPPTEEKVAQFVETCRGDNEPFPPMSPRRVEPTLQTIAANAVMAGCRPEYFPSVVAAVRAVLRPEYNLHGSLATTHPCAPMLILNGPVRQQLGVNCGSNCFGQGWRANAAIGRALELTLLNVGGAKPGEMDRSTQGSPAKFTFCFGENEEESPWEPYHVRRGFAAEDSVVTALPCEPPHNINDHGSTSGIGILMTIAGSIAQTGANTMYRTAPYVVALGPEHAATLKRDGWTIEAMQEKLYEDSAVHASRVSPENRKNFEEWDQAPVNDLYYQSRSPEDIQILVAGGPGKHSAYIPTFGFTEVCSQRIPTR
jgi:hypothetical protein